MSPSRFGNSMQNKRNLYTGLILASIAIGIFLYTVMNAHP
jgi:hypothetical protein